jgi:hypothetical protein
MGAPGNLQRGYFDADASAAEGPLAAPAVFVGLGRGAWPRA